MNLRDRDHVAAVTTAEQPAATPPAVVAAEDDRFKRLEKQIASVSTALGEVRPEPVRQSARLKDKVQ